MGNEPLQRTRAAEGRGGGRTEAGDTCRGHLRIPPSRTAETQGFRATEDKASLQIKCKQKPQPQGCLKSRILKTNNI